MAEKESQFETKQILEPADVIQLLWKMNAGCFTPANLSAQLPGILKPKLFSIGESAKAEKRTAAEKGFVIVQRGIVCVVRNTRQVVTHILLTGRGEGHQITKGGSLLISGDPTQSLDAILGKKVEGIPSLEFSDLGCGFSDPSKTGGVNYLFVVSQSSLSSVPDGVQSKKVEDIVAFTEVEQVPAAITGKPMEENLLRYLLHPHLSPGAAN